MSVLLNFIIGYLASLLGVIPPGLLNMSAAKISMKSGRKNALLFSLGVCLTVMFQTYVALLFARYLDMHPEVVDMLQKVALGIFVCITIYFFFIAKDTRLQPSSEINPSKTNSFLNGMFLAALNLLPLPYWVYVSITFGGFGMFTFEQPGIWATVIASGAGTFTMLALYVQFFKRNADKPLRVNMNYVIGLITATISVITLIKILKYL